MRLTIAISPQFVIVFFIHNLLWHSLHTFFLLLHIVLTINRKNGTRHHSHSNNLLIIKTYVARACLTSRSFLSVFRIFVHITIQFWLMSIFYHSCYGLSNSWLQIRTPIVLRHYKLLLRKPWSANILHTLS